MKPLGLKAGGNALDRWRLARKLSLRKLGALLKCSEATAYRLCLPVSDARFSTPGRPLQDAIKAATDGAVTLALMLDEEQREAA